eukprot:259501-Chlamydomonas_euryale.AAC.1
MGAEHAGEPLPPRGTQAHTAVAGAAVAGANPDEDHSGGVAGGSSGGSGGGAVGGGGGGGATTYNQGRALLSVWRQQRGSPERPEDFSARACNGGAGAAPHTHAQPPPQRDLVGHDGAGAAGGRFVDSGLRSGARGPGAAALCGDEGAVPVAKAGEQPPQDPNHRVPGARLPDPAAPPEQQRQHAASAAQAAAGASSVSDREARRAVRLPAAR